MTVFDRVFTRIGASDRILEGKSTFFVEMEETVNIVKTATRKSLVIIDELGRGTSTFDGYSIANSVLRYLVRRTKCLTLFATHYHMLLQDFRETPRVHSYHMACRQEAHDQVTFLYKFIKGECPKSFGLNVARMAGLPKWVINRAAHKSLEFTKQLNLDEVVTSINNKDNEYSLSDLEGEEEGVLEMQEPQSEHFQGQEIPVEAAGMVL